MVKNKNKKFGFVMLIMGVIIGLLTYCLFLRKCSCKSVSSVSNNVESDVLDTVSSHGTYTEVASQDETISSQIISPSVEFLDCPECEKLL